MSHVTAVDVHITDLDCLKAACESLGLTFKEGQETFAWYGRWVNDYNDQDAAYNRGVATKDYGKCEHAIGVPGSTYEIGVVRRQDGVGWQLVYDFWGPGAVIKDKLGKGCEKLKQGYSVATVQKSMAKLSAKGFRPLDVQQGQDGTVKLVFRRG